MGSIFSPKTFVTFAAFCLLAQGDTVTITKKICPTPTARTTTTTVQSTVFVYPSGWSDSTVNGGTPFVISLFQGGSGPYKRDTTHAAASYLLANGNTTTEYTQAAQYQIVGGQLQLTDGTLLSTNPDTPSMPFLASDNIGSITKTFTCINGSLIWTNTAFNKGYAQFYTNPVNQPSNARTLISFNSLMGYDTEWGLVSLAPQPVPQSGGGSLSGYTHSTTATETPPASASTSGLADISGGLSHYTHGSPTTVSASTSQSTLPTPGSGSPDGSCGHYNGFTCVGAFSGTCCSAYGFCGTGDLYCGAGCQPGYGSCGGSDSGTSTTSVFVSTNLTATPINTVSTSQISVVTTSTPTTTPGSLTPDGSCGGSNGYTCIGAFSGSCCSPFGFCGSGAGYCDTGCQADYGLCDSTGYESSTKTWPTTSQVSIPSGKITIVTTSSVTSPTPTPGGLTPDGSCGGANGYTCIGAFSGSCCSGFGFCGSGEGYCDAGCQPAYGTCHNGSKWT
ncbi:carbohydrate-binding module family 18 protein [Myriangium duriaei CBS 260.36]|uniref:Carbohydrate-binding module family 18 protein n=1 Tax=Myriangium duriaei CBS 260.36 TaxID=1168546 RepID=A0A9P4J8T1_9PEZI|nr:carbohydrate-binding module family 18 protein [Myriangium duriaei CBS 260.36]